MSAMTVDPTCQAETVKTDPNNESSADAANEPRDM
jgi:hypothetical protein